MTRRKFVIDTSLFVNPHARKAFGASPRAAVKGFIKRAKGIDAEFFMPPSVFKELTNFIGETIYELEMVVKKKAPNMYATYLPAAVFYNFIEEMRHRMNKGLRLAEDFAKDNAPDNDTKLMKLRDKYRDAVRGGIVDSKEDLELVLLSKELEATLVSSDEGVAHFANQIGCEWIDAKRLCELFKHMKRRR